MLPKESHLARSRFAIVLVVVLSLCGSPLWPQSRGVKVAVVQYKPVLRDVDSNRKSVVASTIEAAKSGAKIIVQTQMASSGYSFFSREEVSKVAEEIPGTTTKLIAQAARQFKVHVVVGLPEKDGATGRFYNSAVLHRTGRTGIRDASEEVAPY